MLWLGHNQTGVTVAVTVDMEEATVMLVAMVTLVMTVITDTIKLMFFATFTSVI
jgi:hypothetical protein